MAIVGFEYNKIDVQKKDSAKGNINISNNVSIIDVAANDLVIGGAKQSGIKFSFEYRSEYNPDYAKILLGGSIIYLADEKKTKDILNDWKKSKKLSKDIAGQIINSILTKCNIQSIILANTVNLPPPVPMPKVNVQDKPKAEKQDKSKAEKQDKLKK